MSAVQAVRLLSAAERLQQLSDAQAIRVAADDARSDSDNPLGQTLGSSAVYLTTTLLHDFGREADCAGEQAAHSAVSRGRRTLRHMEGAGRQAYEKGLACVKKSGKQLYHTASGYVRDGLGIPKGLSVQRAVVSAATATASTLSARAVSSVKAAVSSQTFGMHHGNPFRLDEIGLGRTLQSYHRYVPQVQTAFGIAGSLLLTILLALVIAGRRGRGDRRKRSHRSKTQGFHSASL